VAGNQMGMLAWKRNIMVIFYLGLLLVVLRAVFFWNLPLNNDEGIYGYTAWMMNQGIMPYQGVMDNKPPLLYVLYLVGLWLSGPGVAWGFRAVATLCCAGTMAGLYLLAVRLFGFATAIWTALLYILCCLGLSWSAPFAESEIFLTFPLIAGLLFFWKARESGRAWHLAACGLSMGLAILIKPLAFLFLLFLAVLLFFPAWRGKLKGIPVSLAALIGGGVLPLGLCALWLWGKGLIGYFWKCVVLFNLIYSSVNMPELDKWRAISDWFFLQGFMEEGLVLCILAGAGLVWAARDGEAGRFAVAAALVGILYFLWGDKFFSFYFIVLLPFVCLLAARCMVGLWRTGPGPARIVLVWMLAVGLFISFHYTGGLLREPRAMYMGNERNRVYALMHDLGQAIQRSAPGDATLYNWGVDTELFFYARRRCPTRYVSTDFLAYLAMAHRQGSPAWLAGFTETFLKSFQEETLADLKRHPPSYIVVSWPNLNPQFRMPNLYLPEKIAGMLVSEYILDRDLTLVRLYRRKPLSGEIPVPSLAGALPPLPTPTTGPGSGGGR